LGKLIDFCLGNFLLGFIPIGNFHNLIAIIALLVFKEVVRGESNDYYQQRAVDFSSAYVCFSTMGWKPLGVVDACPFYIYVSGH